MGIETVEFEGQRYPAFQAQGNAAQFAIPFAKHVCKGRGVDIGCGKKEWAFPEAILVDPAFTPLFHATFFPFCELDYVFSSHCLEHLSDWAGALDYWLNALKIGGVLFLYLPDYSQTYWRPWNNRKHLNVLTPGMIRDYLIAKGCVNIFVSGADLNNSFMAMAEKGVPRAAL